MSRYGKLAARSRATSFTASISSTWDAWESSGRTFWTQMDAVVDMLDGLVGDAGEVVDG